MESVDPALIPLGGTYNPETGVWQYPTSGDLSQPVESQPFLAAWNFPLFQVATDRQAFEDLTANQSAVQSAPSAQTAPPPDVLSVSRDLYELPLRVDNPPQLTVLNTPQGVGMDLFDFTSANQNPYSPSVDLSSFFNAAANDLTQLLGSQLPNGLPTGPIGIGQGGGVVLRPMKITKNAYACGRGMHVAKATKGASVGKCVTNRRMNPLNPRALARATRRLAGFQHFATKTEKVIRHMFTKAGVKPHRIGGRCGTCRKTKCSCG